MTAAPSVPQQRRLPAWIRPALGAAILLGAALVVDDELLSVTWPQIAAAMGAAPLSAVLLAIGALLASLMAASTYDALVLKASDHPLSYGKSAAPSALAFALSQGGSLGKAASLELRKRAYLEAAGGPPDMDRLTRWTTAIGVSGGAAILALGLAAVALGHGHTSLLTPPALIGLGMTGLAAGGLYLALPRRGELATLLPPRPLAWAELAASTLEWVTAALVLYLLLPESRGALIGFLPVYGAARLLGAASGLPSGIGVFDAVVLAAFSPTIPTPELASGLFLYRLIYSATPLVLAACRLAWAITAKRQRGETPAARASREAVNAALPAVLGLLVFVAGIVMLISAATPGFPARVRFSAAFTPIVLLETSHFIDSLIGAALLFLAFGLNGRLRKAWGAAIALLVVGAVSTLLRGLNFEEAIFLGLVVALLFMGRKVFYRTEPLSVFPLTPGMSLSIIAALAATIWLGFFVYRHVAYRDELWWTFVAKEGAPRLLRASVGVAMLALAIFVWRLIQPRARRPLSRDPLALGKVNEVLAKVPNAPPSVNLAFLGDKQFLFSPSGESFIQYATRDRNWVALGEPVGPTAERRAMIWAFRELCDKHGARPVFYSIRGESLADFIDCGFVAAKIGEKAVIDLTEFTLRGRAKQDLRTARSRAEREGLSFAVLGPNQVEGRLDELEALSDAWLENHQGEEKGFSLGRFDRAYVRRFDMAVMLTGDRITAFANLWRSPDGRHLAIDLMRYDADAPPGTMEALIVETLLWAQDRGFESLDLGQTPLAGLEAHRLANFMTRVGSLIYTHAGKLYGFDGLRRFKAKFLPRWESVYIAAPTGWHLPSALGDAALLSSGGVRGLFRQA